MDMLGVLTQEHDVGERCIEADRRPAPGRELRWREIGQRADKETGQLGLQGLNG